MVTETPGWNARNGAASCVYDGKIWVMGGVCPASYLNDVWYSSDGENWTCATTAAPWSARTGHSAVSYDGKMWMIGGGAWGAGFETKNDVWSSTDGVTWTDVSDSAPWLPRMGHSLLVYDNKMWVLAGGNHTGFTINDAWYSTDGDNWTCATSSAAWTARESQYAAVMSNRIWVFAGRGASSNCFNDVWYMNGLGIPDEGSPVLSLFDIQVLPCPSASSVTISWYQHEDGKVKIDIYDVGGRIIETVTDSFHNSGNSSVIWDRNTEDQGRVENGVYFCRFESGGITETKQIILI